MVFCLSDFQEILGVAAGLNAGYAAILVVSDLSFDSIESKVTKTEAYISHMMEDDAASISDQCRQEIRVCRARLQLELRNARELTAADKRVASLLSLAAAAILAVTLCLAVLLPLSVPAVVAWVGMPGAILLPFISGMICWSRADMHMRRTKDLAAALTRHANNIHA